MSLPSLEAYKNAIQNPQYSLIDPVLRACKVESDPLGLPKPRSGGFAVTFKLQSNRGDWAVRCFHKSVPNLEERYQAISRFLSSRNLPGIVGFDYQTEGMRVDGATVPIVKMRWMAGLPLDIYVEENLKNSEKLRRLSARISQTAASLESQGFAHGDLQHGNILVSDAGLTLVDYDGMFVPELAGQTANELGHVNFQSPIRDASHFHNRLDRFSAIVIKLSLEALSHDPSLWGRFNVGDNLLFVRKDFIGPEASAMVSALKTLPGLGHQSEQFVLLCRTPIERLPTLEEFWSGRSHLTTSQANADLDLAHVKLRQYPVAAAIERDALVARVGDLVQVVGEVVQVTERRAGNKRYVFVNFSIWRPGQNQFRLILWSEQVDHLIETGRQPEFFKHKWVSVTGLVQIWGKVPQIIIENNNQIQVLPGGDVEARSLLNGNSAARRTSATKPKQLSRNNEIALQMAQNSQTITRAQQIAVDRTVTPTNSLPLSKLPRTESSRSSNQEIAGQLAASKPGNQLSQRSQVNLPDQVPVFHSTNEKSWSQSHWRAVIVISVLLILLWLLS